MAHLPTDQLHSTFRVFRLLPNGRDLSEIPQPIWQQIANHNRPLLPANGSVKLLLISGRGHGQNSHCEAIDALRLQTDDFGFLMTWDASPSSLELTAPPSAQTQGKSGAQAAAQPGALIDARPRFLQRYIAHRHSWLPGPALLAEALTLAGYPVNNP